MLGAFWQHPAKLLQVNGLCCMTGPVAILSVAPDRCRLPPQCACGCGGFGGGIRRVSALKCIHRPCFFLPTFPVSGHRAQTPRLFRHQFVKRHTRHPASTTVCRAISMMSASGNSQRPWMAHGQGMNWRPWPTPSHRISIFRHGSGTWPRAECSPPESLLDPPAGDFHAGSLRRFARHGQQTVLDWQVCTTPW